MAIGAIREVRFQEGGAIISELVELDPPRAIQWEEIESSSKKVRMVGSGSTKPTFRMRFRDVGDSTQVILDYNFHRVQVPGACCGFAERRQFPGSFTRELLHALPKLWADDMASRGYTAAARVHFGEVPVIMDSSRAVPTSSPSPAAPSAPVVRQQTPPKSHSGFVVSFVIPYVRESVFAELIKFDKPLAADRGIREAQGIRTSKPKVS